MIYCLAIPISLGLITLALINNFMGTSILLISILLFWIIIGQHAKRKIKDINGDP